MARSFPDAQPSRALTASNHRLGPYVRTVPTAQHNQQSVLAPWLPALHKHFSQEGQRGGPSSLLGSSRIQHYDVGERRRGHNLCCQKPSSTSMQLQKGAQLEVHPHGATQPQHPPTFVKWLTVNSTPHRMRSCTQEFVLAHATRSAFRSEEQYGRLAINSPLALTDFSICHNARFRPSHLCLQDALVLFV